MATSAENTSFQLAIVARQQIGVTTSYNPAYISPKSPKSGRLHRRSHSRASEDDDLFTF